MLTRFAQPADIKGTGFLQIENSAADDDIWVYLPALGKTRRLASNNKRDSFFGTDFAYGDILLPAVDGYEHALLRKENVDGVECHVVESTPRDARTRDDTGYGRRISWVDARTFVERKVEYYDTGNVLLKTQLTFDVQAEEPGRFMPMRRQMTNHQTAVAFQVLPEQLADFPIVVDDQDVVGLFHVRASIESIRQGIKAPLAIHCGPM